MNTSSPSPYDSSFYDRTRNRSYSSALATLGFLWRYYAPVSVVDVGCGSGTWLKAAAELGAKDIQGLEGAWMSKEIATIPFENIQIADLSKAFALPRTFDMAISMEVAEHLPAASAKGFVACITKLAPVVLFSAAVPKQDGVGHVNEQWPAYWADFFREEGYVALDLLRSHLWDNPDVEWWYSQNAVVYIKEAFFNEMATFRELTPYRVVKPLPLVHPELFAKSERPGLRKIFFNLLPGGLSRAVGRAVKK